MYDKPAPTPQDKEKGYQVCVKCLDHVHLLQAGFDCRHVICEQCGYSVAVKSEFFEDNGI